MNKSYRGILFLISLNSCSFELPFEYKAVGITNSTTLKKQDLYTTPKPILPTFSDVKSFEDIYNTYWSKVYATCYNTIKEREVAQEMVQDIFKSLWERKDELEIKTSVENYLVRSAKFKVFEYIRNKTTQKKHLACALEDYCSVSNCTENEILYENLTEKVGLLVDRLPCQCRNVYNMSRTDALTNKEISSRLLISERAVEQHITKALRFLRENLQEYRS
ncbi:RNA polymerase sigma-70 factor [uncultured Cytophaga sp.]|uniref:RNA polymerase sigma-70 factor n=1 Tax=uncultured Cytophaga sp. TaxID=160238 RepID=UPI002602B7AB|nr:RNA polymerase sigma-70 factor [uncultured Cytophaga sp.]